MNQTQRRIILRLGSMSFVLMMGYILILLYLKNAIDENGFVEILVIITVVYLGLLIILWYREKNLYFDYIMQKRIDTGQAEYLLCPNCKVIQKKGQDICETCGQDWILCKVCQVPFEDGSQVLVAPCCGEGFHYDHFESALRELSYCPYCGSDMALETTNW